jgi:hypothetical protein
MNRGLELYHLIHGELLILLHGGVGAIEDGRNYDWDRCRTPVVYDE